MKIDTERIKKLCRQRESTLHEMLAEAGVSPNAYYTLARKQSILPGTVMAVADCLGVNPTEILLDEESSLVRHYHELIKRLESIMRRHRRMDRDNVRHTLLLLEEPPIERLRRALRRAG